MPRYVSRILSSFASLVLLLVMVFFLSRPGIRRRFSCRSTPALR